MVLKMDPWKILRWPYVTEKTVKLVEKENKIVFIVDRKATKKQIKEAFEKVFEVKVEKVNTLIDFKGRKKAFIKLKPEFKAIDVAVKLGIM
jgi:large subunit ribosomal protein L23